MLAPRDGAGPVSGEEWATWAHLCAGVGTRFAGRPAIVDEHGTLTYEDLGVLSGEIARGLIAEGLEPGERVGVWLPNGAAWVGILMGILRAGGTIVPLSTRLRGYEVAEILRRAQARRLFLVDHFLGERFDRLLAMAEPEESVPLLTQRFRIALEPGGGAEMKALRDRAHDVPDSELARRLDGIGPDHPTDLLFTSGTTGWPKGVLNTSRRSLQAYSELASIMRLSPEDVYMVIGPFSHSLGLKAGLLAAQLAGAAVVPVAQFDPAAVLRDVDRYGVTVLPGPPTVFLSLLNHPQRTVGSMSSLRCGMTGAASIPVEMVRRVRAELAMDVFLTAYGLTEASAIVTSSRPEDDDEHIATTSGRPITGVEVRVADPDGGARRGPGETGEVQVRGYVVMDGYLDPADDDDAFTGDGWLRTGDIGSLTTDGYLRLTDRLKDLFIVGGFNVAPAEVEAVLCTHPRVSEAAVIGVPDERLGEVGMAFLLPRPGTTPELDDVLEYCRRRLANYKVPRRVVVVDDLPRTAAGKVQKFLLRKEHCAD